MDFQMENKINHESYHISCRNLNGKVKTLKFIEENIAQYLLGFEIDKESLKHKKLTITEHSDKIDFIKIKKLS